MPEAPSPDARAGAVSPPGAVLRVAHIVAGTEAEGPGARTAIWMQGCRIRCAGCCNPELFGAAGGEWMSVEALAARVVGGVTLLGGEPVDQPEGVTALARAVHEQGGSVIVFSGYERAEVEARAPELLRWVDVLVDGPFDAAQPEVGGRGGRVEQPGGERPVGATPDGPAAPGEMAGSPGVGGPRRWVGSRNQGLHFLTDRYGPADFRGANTVELRLVNGALTVNGWPARGTVRR